MTKEIEPTKKRGLLETFGDAQGMDAERVMTVLKQTVIKGKATDGEIMAFLAVANKYSLDPFCKEIYAFPQGGGIQPIMGVDGFFAIANRHEEYRGIEFEYEYSEDGKPLSATCRIHRADRDFPIEAIEFYEECYRDTKPWNQTPRRMLRHRAAAQAIRMAFSVTGIMEKDEGEAYQETIKQADAIVVTEDRVDDIANTIETGRAEMIEANATSTEMFAEEDKELFAEDEE